VARRNSKPDEPSPAPERRAGPAIEDQIKAVTRLREVLAHQYRALVRSGEITVPEAKQHLDCLEMAARSLEWLSEHRSMIHEIVRRKAVVAEEIEEMMKHPVVIAVLEAFPSAKIVDIRPIEVRGASGEKTDQLKTGADVNQQQSEDVDDREDQEIA
jgi:hypothetical protein